MPLLEMNSWFETELGQQLLDIEADVLEKMLGRRFGYHLLQLGCADLLLYQNSPIGHKFSFCETQNNNHLHNAIASGEAIPLANESIDLVLLHHALDFSPQQHQLLREASRVLIAGGHILIVGFNPYSSWGMRNKLQWNNKAPWHADMLSSARVVDWLKLLEFQVEHVQYGAYSLPVNSSRVIKYSSIMGKLAMKLNWPTGGMYIISARKQVQPLTPIQASWKKHSPAVAGMPVSDNITRVDWKRNKAGKENKDENK